MRERRPAEDVEEITRRNFASSLVAATALGLLPAAEAQSNFHALEVTEAASDLGSKPEDLSAADWDQVQAKHANLLRVYGARLSVDEKRHASAILKTNQHMLASIRTFELQNGDPSGMYVIPLRWQSAADQGFLTLGFVPFHILPFSPD